jgi:hypothetical protein
VEAPIRFRRRHLHSVSWLLQLEILERTLFWVKEVLVECIRAVWKIPVRLVELIIFVLFIKEEKMKL